MSDLLSTTSAQAIRRCLPEAAAVRHAEDRPLLRDIENDPTTERDPDDPEHLRMKVASVPKAWTRTQACQAIGCRAFQGHSQQAKALANFSGGTAPRRARTEAHPAGFSAESWPARRNSGGFAALAHTIDAVKASRYVELHGPAAWPVSNEAPMKLLFLAAVVVGGLYAYQLCRRSADATRPPARAVRSTNPQEDVRLAGV